MTIQPSGQLIDQWIQALKGHEPFSRMERQHLIRLICSGRERYAAPGACLNAPEDGVPQQLCWLRQGVVIGYPQDTPERAFELDAGSLWPVSALLADRPVRTRYVVRDDCFYFVFPWVQVQELMAQSPVLSEHLHQLGWSLLKVSQQQLQQQLQSHYQQAVRLEQSLSALPEKNVLCMPETVGLHDALAAMHERQVGSVLLTDARAHLCGILTREDVIGRAVLPQLAPETPVSQVMSHPVVSIDSTQTLEDAAVLMSQHGIRHLPVLRGERVVNLVSERDLFSLQRQSPRHVDALLQQARSLIELQRVAQAIRELAGQLMAQGVAPLTMTRLLSDLNDKLTARTIVWVLGQAGLSDRRFCWVALGSEGRREQTIATDQDNALVFESEHPDADRPRWLAFARQVNEALAECGFPLCRGGIMASTPAWCHTPSEWRQMAADWIERGTPEDLLNTAIWFDLRAIFGQAAWVDALRQDCLQQVQANPRFLRQWVEQHLRSGVALNWLGGLATESVHGRDTIDIKHAGTAIVVDAARILALSCGLSATSTSERLHQAGRQLGIPEAEYQGWVTAFSYLQTLRLRQQLLASDAHADLNRIDIDQLNTVDKQTIKWVLRSIRSLQQRLQLDYIR